MSVAKLFEIFYIRLRTLAQTSKNDFGSATKGSARQSQIRLLVSLSQSHLLRVCIRAMSQHTYTLQIHTYKAIRKSMRRALGASPLFSLRL